MIIEWDAAHTGITGQELSKLMLDTEPRIILEGGRGSRPSQMASSVGIMPYMMMPGDDKDRGRAALRAAVEAAKIRRSRRALRGSGKGSRTLGCGGRVQAWHGSPRTLTFEQNEAAQQPARTRVKSFRRGAGSVAGDQVHAHAGHRIEGTELHFAFNGTVSGDHALTGTVNLGEYGAANFTAQRQS